MIREKKWAEACYMFAHWHSLRESHRLDFLTAACVLMTRECHERVGGYDEEYSFGCEDIDHSLRVKESGFKLAIAKDATAVHHESRTIGRGNHHASSAETFARKWGAARVKALRSVPDVYHRAEERGVGA